MPTCFGPGPARLPTHPTSTAPTTRHDLASVQRTGGLYGVVERGDKIVGRAGACGYPHPPAARVPSPQGGGSPGDRRVGLPLHRLCRSPPASGERTPDCTIGGALTSSPVYGGGDHAKRGGGGAPRTGRACSSTPPSCASSLTLSSFACLPPRGGGAGAWVIQRGGVGAGSLGSGRWWCLRGRRRGSLPPLQDACGPPGRRSIRGRRRGGGGRG